MLLLWVGESVDVEARNTHTCGAKAGLNECEEQTVSIRPCANARLFLPAPLKGGGVFEVFVFRGKLYRRAF